MTSKAVELKHGKFIDGVMKGKTLVQAYREAGYQAKTDTAAWSSASEIFRNPQVQAEIQRRRDVNLAKDMISLDVLRADAMIQAQRIIREGTNDDKVQAGMIKDILDRAGLKPVEKAQLEHSGAQEINVQYKIIRPKE